MTALELAREHHRDRQKLATSVQQEGRRLWRLVDFANLASWASLAARLLVILAGAQRNAASQADEYTDAVLAEQGIATDAAGDVAARRLAGIASDGRPLHSLLHSPVTATKVALARGESRERALAVGQSTLDMVTRTQVADAGRVADGLAITARPRVGYVRMLVGDSCPRCAILAGRFYRYSDGFLRHPRCDCTMIPTAEATSEDFSTNPQAALDEGRIKGLTNAEQQALADGANLNQVVNARRGMTAAGTTTEGTTRRGVAGARLITGDPTAFVAPRDSGGRTRVVSTHTRQTRRGEQTVRIRGAQAERLMPERIYQIAESRDDAIALLRLHGYIL